MKFRRPNETLLLGVDPVDVKDLGNGNKAIKPSLVGAVSYFGLDEDERDWVIFAIARAHRLRGQGAGRSAIQSTLKEIRRQSPEGGPERSVIARIHPANDASRRAFKDEGFDFVDLQGGLELWGRDP